MNTRRHKPPHCKGGTKTRPVQRFILEKKERVALLLGEEFVVIESEESVDES